MDDMFKCVVCGKVEKEPITFCSNKCRLSYLLDHHTPVAVEQNDSEHDDEFQSKFSDL